MEGRHPRRTLAPPSSLRGGSAHVLPPERDSSRSAGRRRSQLSSEHLLGHSSHITDGGARPLLHPRMIGRELAGSPTAVLAKKIAEGPQKHHFFSETSRPHSYRCFPAPPPHSDRYLRTPPRACREEAAHLEGGSSIRMHSREPRTDPTARHTCGNGLVGSAVLTPSDALEKHTNRGGSSAMRATFDGGAARNLIFVIP